MQEKPFSPLSQAERNEVCALAAAGLPLPPRYRELLFQAEEPSTPPSIPSLQPREVLSPETRPWINALIQGDNRDILPAALSGPLAKAIRAAGGVRLIYLDPPFATGSRFPLFLDLGGQRSDLAAIAYTDSRQGGSGTFLRMLFPRLALMRDLLAEDGSLYLHCDYRSSAMLRLFLDHLFGADHFLGEIIWHYTGGGRSRRYFSRKHDTILHYARSRRWIFRPEEIRVPYAKTSGYARGGIVSAAGKRYLPNPRGTPVDDVWSLPIVNPMSRERLPYPTQKPEALLERILRASSRPGDLVADFFCGSGTTLAVAERLGRKWLGADSSPFAIQTSRKRLLLLRRNLENPPPFAVLDCVRNGPPDTLPPGRHLVVSLRRQSFAYAPPEIRARVRTTGDGMFLELCGFVVKDSREEGELVVRRGLLHRRKAGEYEPLMRSWQDWVDSWDLDPDHVPGRFVSRWQSLRERGSRELTLRGPILPAGASLIAVRVVDIFAREHIALLPCPPLAGDNPQEIPPP
ncbi:MAG: site-specific DNA-methyltransferase [Desulfovibrio sp.]|jgi:DNA modification methylase|nr:site-specific DNA-methyltransferase [Desulfovibrio sp.]